MLDIELFRKNPETIKISLEKRRADTSIVDTVLALDKEWRAALKTVEDLKKKKNLASKEVADLKKAGKSADAKIADMKRATESIATQDAVVEERKHARDKVLRRVPNLLHDSVPYGKDDSENVLVRSWGKAIERDIPTHGEILESLGLADFKAGSKISGAGFNFLKGDFALLDYALQRLAIDIMIKKGFTLVEPPFMMRRAPYEGVTDLADFENVMYKIEGDDLYLIATSEHPLVGQYQDEVIAEEELPLTLVGSSPCFRREIGSKGVDTKGIYRVHQFNKVEQIVICKPEDSWQWHEKLIANEEEIIKALELPYRVVNICTGDIGTVAAKKYDLEVWSPRQKKYIEAGSASNCTDYQARRLNIKYGKRGGDTQLVHTLNDTAMATPRPLVSLVENNYEDGVIRLPKALWGYMNGKKEIGGKQ